ncbi:hypothetical protein Tco_1182959 [Tanacetum coccineum]
MGGMSTLCCQGKELVLLVNSASLIFEGFHNKSLQHILDQKELNMRQRRWLELLSDNDCEIRYHPGKILNAQAEAKKAENIKSDDLGEEPMEIMDREVRQLKQSRIPFIKVRWNSRRGLDFTWERKDQFEKKYLHLFADLATSSNATT